MLLVRTRSGMPTPSSGKPVLGTFLSQDESGAEHPAPIAVNRIIGNGEAGPEEKQIPAACGRASPDTTLAHPVEIKPHARCGEDACGGRKQDLSLLLFCSPVLPLSLPSCGGSSAGKVVSILLSPSPVSVAYGQSNITLTAAAVNSGNATVSTTFTFSSSNAAAISISPAGLICGGSWDANFVTCSPPVNRTPQSATITVTAQNVTQTVQAYVHEKVDGVMVSGFRPPQGTFSTSYPGIGASGAACAQRQLHLHIVVDGIWRPGQFNSQRVAAAISGQSCKQRPDGLRLANTLPPRRAISLPT